MLVRYWGDRHADVQQFQSLVDRRSGGIADSTLIDAILARGWNAQRLDGSIATIHDELDAGHPLILLIEDRPLRYHYVVAVGHDDQHVFVHDPTWGPASRLDVPELMRRWKPTGFWTLLVTTGENNQSTKRDAAPRNALTPRDALKGVPYLNDSAPDLKTANDRAGSANCNRLLD